MPDDLPENLPSEPETIILETEAEPETLPTTEQETITEDEPAWQQTEQPTDQQLAETEIAAVSQQVNELFQNLTSVQGVITDLRAQVDNQANLLQSAQPGLSLLAQLADATTDRKTKRQIRRQIRNL